MKHNVVVTGSSGFIGSHLVPFLEKDYEVTRLSFAGIINELSFKNIDTVIHLAGKAHSMDILPSEIYFDSNYRKTKVLAEYAKKIGVKHFIFISSIKVYGDCLEGIYNEFNNKSPDDDYGKSKSLAEDYLLSISDASFKITILRLPLVYGKGVKGNLQKLESMVLKLFVLPFGNINNMRSMVNVNNVVDIILCIVKHPVNNTYIVCDDITYSTTELVKFYITKNNLKRVILPVPVFLQKILIRINRKYFSRLFADLVIENEFTKKQLNYTPKYNLYNVE